MITALTTTQHTGVGTGLIATDLVHHYGKPQPGVLPALGGVSLAIAPGDTIAVMGASGSGKTTLLHVLAGILRPTSGRVAWNGRDLGSMSDADRSRLRRSQFGFVFQSGQLLPELTVLDNIGLPLLLDGVPRTTATARASSLLGPLGLTGFEGRRPGELSGGQAQRVAIARALVGTPGVVFADEPTGALDERTGNEVMHLLSGLCAQHGASLVVVTHEAAVATWCRRTVSMRDGHLTEAVPQHQNRQAR